MFEAFVGAENSHFRAIEMVDKTHGLYQGDINKSLKMLLKGYH